MNVIRRQLIGFACAWVFAQLVVLMATPMSLAAAAGGQDGCSCPHAGGDAACPMHNHAAPQGAGCHCRSNTADPGTAALGALLGPAGVLTAASAAPVPPDVAAQVGFSPSLPVSWMAVPDGPPPRA